MFIWLVSSNTITEKEGYIGNVVKHLQLKFRYDPFLVGSCFCGTDCGSASSVQRRFHSSWRIPKVPQSEWVLLINLLYLCYPLNLEEDLWTFIRHDVSNTNIISSRNIIYRGPWPDSWKVVLQIPKSIIRNEEYTWPNQQREMKKVAASSITPRLVQWAKVWPRHIQTGAWS